MEQENNFKPSPPPSLQGDSVSVEGEPPVAPPTAVSKGAGKDTAALVCGVLAIVTSAIPIFGIGFGIAALVLAIQYLKLFGENSEQETNSDGIKKAKRGRVCGIIGISLGVVSAVVCAVVLVAAMGAITPAELGAGAQPYASNPPVSQEVNPSGSGEAAPEKDDDVIIAGGVDTSSKYTFSVETAVVGMDEYSDAPVVILMGEFTNNSDETISFSSALDADAMQGGYELDTAYLRGAASLGYENIAPGKTIPVLIGWELRDGESKIEIVVRDEYHYAKKTVYEKSFTIDELLANTERFSSELDGIIDEGQELTA